jgi:hypothetical protein
VTTTARALCPAPEPGGGLRGRLTGRPATGLALALAVGLCLGLTVGPAAPASAAAAPAGPGEIPGASVAAATDRPSGRGTDQAARAARPVRTALARWSREKRWRSGERRGVVVRGGSIRIGDPVGVRRFDDPHSSAKARRYAYGRWVSPFVRPGFGFREMIPSWSARSRNGTWLQPEVRIRTRSGRLGDWDVLGHWQGRINGLHDATLGSQQDDVAGVSVDTVKTHSAAKAWQLRLTLYRRAGTARSPVVSSVSGVASTPPPSRHRVSAPGRARGTVLGVRRYSQMIHKGHYPQWGGGGEAWCSPTSMAMVLASWGRGPTRKQYAWVKSSHGNPQVDHAARMTYDHRYRGTGNWAFTAAYAGTRGLDAFVTRLRSLRAAERYIDARIPLVLSIAFGPGELDGAPIGSSNGHLLVLRGFTKSGRPIVNDPAAPRNRSVRRVYSRAQLERAWITSTAGTAYVARPARVSLPRQR